MTREDLFALRCYVMGTRRSSWKLMYGHLRVYKFLPSRFALEDIRERRLKVSLLEHCWNMFYSRARSIKSSQAAQA